MQEKVIKKLWGLAAGKCSKPGCGYDCIQFLNDDPTVIGEMAHIIPQSPIGPRGDGVEFGSDDYENLILLCPTHHREIDKASDGIFPEDMIRDWKARHEAEITSRLQGIRFNSKQEFGTYVAKLLMENHSIWSQFGPESDAAQRNPLSSLYEIWELRKIGGIIPNNAAIVHAIELNNVLIDPEDLECFIEFKEHALAFERSSMVRTEDVPRFPNCMKEKVANYARSE